MTNKHCFIALMAVLCAAGALRGQHYVGVKNSFGINDISTAPTLSTKTVATAFNPAVVYHYAHTHFAALQAELGLVNKGYALERDSLPALRHRIVSVELPLSTQLFIRLGVFRPYFTGGVTVGYIVGRTVDSLGVRRDYVFDRYDRRFEYGLAVGLGTGVGLGRFELQLEGRYRYNFSFLRQPVIAGRTNQYINATTLGLSACLLYRFAR